MKKSNFYLIGTFAVLLVITFLILRKESGSYSTNKITEKFVTFDSAAVDKIEIVKRAEKITLEKIGGEWNLSEPLKFPADQDVVNRLLSETKEGTLTNLVSSNPEKQSLFQVDSTGNTVTIYERGNKKDAFIVGKPGPDYLSTYIRKVNSNNVYLVKKSLSYDYSKSVKEWRNKTILKTPLAGINQVKMEYGDTVFNLKKTQTGWFVDADTANLNTVESFLSSVSSLNADDFIDTPVDISSKPTAIFSISSANQDIIKFFRFPDKSNKYYVQNIRSPQLYVLESYSANNLLKRKKDFLK